MVAGSKRARRYLTSADLPYRKDQNGKPLCRWCQKPVAPPRRSWCSDECVKEYLMRSSGDSLRSAVFRRDEGVCRACGCDTERLKRILDHARHAYSELTRGLFEMRDWQDWPAYAIWKLFRRAGFNGESTRTLWEADHIVEVCNGGETSLDNMQTLCVPCHKLKTKQMHAERKFQRTGIRPKPPVQETQLKMI